MNKKIIIFIIIGIIIAGGVYFAYNKKTKNIENEMWEILDDASKPEPIEIDKKAEALKLDKPYMEVLKVGKKLPSGEIEEKDSFTVQDEIAFEGKIYNSPAISWIAWGFYKGGERVDTGWLEIMEEIVEDDFAINYMPEEGWETGGNYKLYLKFGGQNFEIRDQIEFEKEFSVVK